MILHREIWKSYFGVIPKDHHIHHIDKNKENNDISNLACILRSDHHRLHGSEPKSKEWARELCALIRPLTKKWHASEQGNQWHKMHAKEMGLGKWKPIKYYCEKCSKDFESAKLSNTRFCSNLCKSKYRRDSGIDDIELYCEWCSRSFKRNKYAKTKCCSKSCGSKMRENKKHSKS